MAAGKSTVGKELADRLGWSFHDLDALVDHRCMAKYGSDISGLIDRGDEDLFRLEERKFVTDELSLLDSPVVVSLGGGTLHNDTLGNWLEQHTRLIVLQVSWGTVKNRILRSNRPLKAMAKALYTNRQQGYNRGYQVVVDLKSVIEVVDILELWIRRGH